MFMSILTLRSAMIDAAKWFKAMKLRSSFSYRTSSLRNRLNQLCATSTTQRLAFFVGSFLSSLASCPPSLDMRDVAMLLNDLQCRRSGVASVSTQMLVSPLGRVRSADHYTVEYRL